MPQVKLRKQDAELLAVIADEENPLAFVYYVPGREHATNSEARTRYSFQRFQPATAGFKDFVRVTAPVNRLVDAGLVEFESAERRCRVTLTQAGRDYLAPAKAPALEDVKSDDVITYRVFSVRSEKWITRRVRVLDPYVWEGRLMVKGEIVNKDGSRAKVQPRYGVWDTVEADKLVAINA